VTKPNFYPVILAGGSGTRFWPRSRRTRAKQVLALDGTQTMIQKTVERLSPASEHKNFWVITNEFVAEEIQRQLPNIPEKQIVIEPSRATLRLQSAWPRFSWRDSIRSPSSACFPPIT